MYSISNYEYECTRKCKSIEHGSRITALLTKRSISDEKLLLFIAKSCRNVDVVDCEGRTALHMAASLNRFQIVEFLLINGANFNCKDSESGQTPLHRAIYYGAINVAVLLMRWGAGIDQFDYDFKSPLNFCLVKAPAREFNETETFTWGSNKYYNLGLDDSDQSSQTPKCVDFFRRLSVSIVDVSLSSFHCLFLTSLNELYSVGHGNGGRLGLGHDNTVVQPQKVDVPLKAIEEKIVCISAAKNHSLILTDKNNVYACGLNSDGQLGIQNVERSSKFLEINCVDFIDLQLIKVLALDHHSIAFSKKEIFVWGRNNGQLGLRSKEDGIIGTPQKLALSGLENLLLDSCNTGLVFYTNNKMLQVFSNFKMRFVKTPNLDVIINLSVGDASGVLKILVLTDSYKLFCWDEESQKYTKCYFPACRQLNINELRWSGNRMVFLCDGDVFLSTTINVVNFNEADDRSEYQEIYSTKKDILQTSQIKIGLKRIPLVSQVKHIWVDYAGTNFALIRDSPKNHLAVPELQDTSYNLKVLFDEMSEDDLIHDIVFHVDRCSFPAHKFVIMSRCHGDRFRKIVEDTQTKDCYLNIDGLTSVAFSLILKIIYLNHSLTENDILKLKESYQSTGELASLGTFSKAMKEIGMGYYLTKMKKKLPPMSFDRTTYENLHDVTIRCANGRELRAHKCILVSRLKYFHMMFNNSWMETAEVNFETVPLEYVELLIKYLYDNSSSRILGKKYTESFICNMIVLTDQLFIESLKEIFEVHFLKRLTMKRCAELLEIATIYNCSTLKTHVLSFICANLAELLELRLLETLDNDDLCEIAKRYQEIFPDISYRQIVPNPEADDEEYVSNFVKDFKLEMDTKAGQTKSSIKGIKTASKTKVDYEKLGKLSLLKDDLNQEKRETNDKKEASNIRNVIDGYTVRVAQELEQKSQQLWTRVTDKKTMESSKKKILLNANEILSNERKIVEKFSNLKLVLNGGGESVRKDRDDELNTSNELDTTPSASSSAKISFGDFLSPPSHGKMSQRERKKFNRLSESDPIPVTPLTTASPKENAWNIVPNVSPVQLSQDLSFRSPKLQKNYSSVTDTSPLAKLVADLKPSFDKILKDEEREKVYFDKLKTKSLNLTQLEELAIGDLRAFYNVEEVHDELIVIERNVRLQTSLNISQWASSSKS